MTWINTEKVLPPLGKYVLVRHTRPWNDRADQANVRCSVAKRVEDKIQFNNLKNYSWSTFGATDFFGQDVYCWQWIEPLGYNGEDDG